MSFGKAASHRRTVVPEVVADLEPSVALTFNALGLSDHRANQPLSTKNISEMSSDRSCRNRSRSFSESFSIRSPGLPRRRCGNMPSTAASYASSASKALGELMSIIGPSFFFERGGVSSSSHPHHISPSRLTQGRGGWCSACIAPMAHQAVHGASHSSSILWAKCTALYGQSSRSEGRSTFGVGSGRSGWGSSDSQGR